MRYSKIGLQSLTEAFEGCKLVAYKDSGGVFTIGYGHTAHVYEGMTCTQEQAECWLMQDTQTAEAMVNRLAHVKLTQGEFDALVDLCFNIGGTRFANSTLLDDLNRGNYEAAANEFEKWDKCGGVVVAGLLRRRLAEKEMFKA